MAGREAKSQTGMTLIEVLASVVILALFMAVMLTLTSQFYIESKLNLQKQQATSIAENILAQMSAEGAQNVIDNPPNQPSPSDENGVKYTVSLTRLNTPAWAAEEDSVYAEVKVSWSAIQAGKKVSENVNVQQLFPGEDSQ